MIRVATPLVLAAALSVATVLAASIPAQERALPKPTDSFEVPDGCKVQLFAESPHLFNPTAIDVDHKGRVWVTEAVNYRGFRNKGDRRKHEKGDRVVILEDTDGDGTCDSSKVFVQEKDLLCPLGICVIGKHVLVSCSPHAILYTDHEGDDVPDTREVFLTGFGGRNHDHGLHSFVPGPDGYLYFNAGNAGPHLVTDRKGWKLRSRNSGGLQSDDFRIWIQGLVMRVRPDGTELRVLAHNFRNPYEVAIDAFGDMWQSDNDDDGNQGCRTSWVMEGGNYGYASANGKRSWRADRRPGQSKWIAHWHQDDPGVMPAGSSNGAGGPTGVAVYEGPTIPGCPTGSVLNCDAGTGVVYAHIPMRKGAGFELRRTVFMHVKRGTGGKRARWFRPSDVAVAPDGSLLVADWYDPGVGGHAAGDRAAYGRILRVRGPGMPLAAPDLRTTAGLARALGNPAPSVRGVAFRTLQRRGAKAHAAVVEELGSESPRQRARAFAWIVSASTPTMNLVENALKDRDAGVRIAAMRAMRTRFGTKAILDEFRDRGFATDPSPGVRREFLLALASIPFGECKSELITIAKTIDPTDRFMVEAFGLAARDREAKVYTWLLANIGDQPAKWSDRMAALAWRLHPKESVPAHFARAMTAQLPETHRVQALDAIAFVKEKVAATAMLKLAQSGPADTRAHAEYWLRHRGANDWAHHGLGGAVSKRGGAKLLWRSGVMSKGTEKFDVQVTPGRTLWLVVSDGGNGYSCDWADWIEPTFLAGQTPIALTSLRWSKAKTGWGRVRVDKNANGALLSTDGKTALRGLGTHAPSEIVYRVPKHAKRFRGRVGPDFGGLSQGCGTSVEFLIYLENGKGDRDDAASWRKKLLDATEGRAAIAAAMAKDAAGARVLLGLIEQGKLPADVKPTVAKAIFQNKDQSVRLLAARHFPVPGTENLNLPSIEKIAALRGVAKKGATHFQKACATCHVFRGEGKDIGPELTQIRRKYGTAALLESILNPDAAIAFGYENWVIEKKDGDVLIGFLLAEGENVVLKDQEGKRHIFAAAEIASKTRSKTSLMPASLVAGMRAQDLADLAAFLLQDGK